MTCNIDGARLYSTYVVGKAGDHKGPPRTTPPPSPLRMLMGFFFIGIRGSLRCLI